MRSGPVSFVKRRHVLLIAASAFIAGTLYLGGSMLVGLDDVASALQRAGPACAIAAVLSSLFNVTVRFLRWHLFLRVLGHELPVSVNFPIYLAGFSLTTIPGKLGELIRSVFLHEHGVSYSKTVAAFFADRLSDLMGVLLSAALLSWFLYPAARFLLAALAIGLAIALVAVRTAGLPVAGRLLRVAPASWRLEQKLAGFVALFEHLGTCLSPRVFGLGVLAAILAYSAQALALLYIVKALSGDVSAPAVFLSFFVSTLGGAASMLPAGLGSMEAALVALLSHFGMPLPSAVAATVLIRLATLWFVVAMGLICLTWVHLRHHTPEGARAVQL